MEKHKIDWLNMPSFKGETWNPFVGCAKVSPACKNCYAEKMAFRLSNIALTKNKPTALDYYVDVISWGKWNGKTEFVEPALEKPLHWKKPRMIFVCSMSDLFHENNSFKDIDSVFGIFSQTPQHKYILLTKRPKRALEFFKWFGNQIKEIGFDSVPSQSDDPLHYYSPLENIWIGTTVEDPDYKKRIDDLLKIPASVHFVSIEPMLAGMDISDYLHDSDCNEVRHEIGCICHDPREVCLDWVICGGESGHNARPMHPDWVRSIRDQCKEAGTPFFFKQMSQHDFKDFKNRDSFPVDLRMNEFPRL
jgi:protein gp37